MRRQGWDFKRSARYILHLDDDLRLYTLRRELAAMLRGRYRLIRHNPLTCHHPAARLYLSSPSDAVLFRMRYPDLIVDIIDRS